jgi:hypothetical protein
MLKVVPLKLLGKQISQVLSIHSVNDIKEEKDSD